jgi:hypothetical protein
MECELPRSTTPRSAKRRWVIAISFSFGLVFVGCAQPAIEDGDQALQCLAADGALTAAEQAHGFSAPVPIRVAPIQLAPGSKHVVYLNRNPRTYVAGVDDAQIGSSSVLAAQSVKRASLGGFQQGDEAWNGLVQCVREQYARFDIAVTDVRPITPGYIEAHFGGSGPEVGITDGSGGIAPIDSQNCGTVDGAVVYVFSDLFGPNLRSICEVGAHEIGHAFSLDHEYRCKDPMTYVMGCGDKEFQLDDAPCGESSARACICGRTSQNSVDILQAALGDHVSDLQPPTVELMPPIADATGRFTYLQVRAHDPDAALRGIELHVITDGDAGGVETVSRCGDGRLPCTLDGELASFALPAAQSDQRVWAVAEDTGGNRTSTLEAVVRAGPPEAAALALAVAPVAARYNADGIVEVQALVIGEAPITEAVAVWTDGDGQVREIPLCARSGHGPDGSEGRLGVSVHLGHGSAARSFHVRVTDQTGRVATSPDAHVVVAP